MRKEQDAGMRSRQRQQHCVEAVWRCAPCFHAMLAAWPPTLQRLAPAVEALLPLFEPVPPATDAAWWEAEGDQIGQVRPDSQAQG